MLTSTEAERTYDLQYPNVVLFDYVKMFWYIMQSSEGNMRKSVHSIVFKV